MFMFHLKVFDSFKKCDYRSPGGILIFLLLEGLILTRTNDADWLRGRSEAPSPPEIAKPEEQDFSVASGAA